MRDYINELIDLTSQLITILTEDLKDTDEEIDKDFYIFLKGKIDGLESAKVIMTELHKTIDKKN